MLHDVFICHASEDKESFVRALAEALRAHNIEVWYDEFSLQVGDSIRRAIDKGLQESRFGVIVFSRPFFEKQWPQYELDGLLAREMCGQDRVLLPIWHEVEHADVLRHVPALAGRKAIRSSVGLDKAVNAIASVIRPQGSPLVVARDTLLQWGLLPPVITDEYWLDVVEASNRTPGFGAVVPVESAWSYWSFPLPPSGTKSSDRGTRLAWTAMQLQWTVDAEKESICPLTPADQVLEFIERHAGLLETCIDFPDLVVEYAPQLAIPGFGGALESTMEVAFQKSCDDAAVARARNSQSRLQPVVGRKSRLCSEEWAIRHCRFGNFEPYQVANAYFHGGLFGPTVSPFEDADHLFWLLSSASSWLPKRIHKTLLEGVSSWVTWVWNDEERDAPFDLTLQGALWNAASGKRRFRLSRTMEDQIRRRCERTISELNLPESPQRLLEGFIAQDLPRKYIAAEKELRRHREASSARARKARAKRRIRR